MKSFVIITAEVSLIALTIAIIHYYIIEVLNKYIKHGLWLFIKFLLITPFANFLLYQFETFNSIGEMYTGVLFFNIYTGVLFSIIFDPLLNRLRGKEFSYVSQSRNKKKKSKLDSIFYSQGFWAGYVFYIFLAIISFLFYKSTIV